MAAAHWRFSHIRQVVLPMCTPSSTPQLTSSPYRCCPLPSRSEYIDHRTCPGICSGPAHFRPPNFPIHLWGSGPPSNTWFLGLSESTSPKRHFDRFSRFGRAHGRYGQTDQSMQIWPRKRRTMSHWILVVRHVATYCGILRHKKVKVKASHTRYRALGPELIPVYRQSACRWP